MNNETRLRNLFTYLDGLANLAVSDYRCNNEIAECIKAIREELVLPKAAKVITPEQLRWLTAEEEAKEFTERLAKEYGDAR